MSALGRRVWATPASDRSSVRVDSRTSGRPSMLPWFWVADSGYVRASLVSVPPRQSRGRGASNLERVEPDARADPAGVRTAIAERQGDHAVRHAGEDRDGKLERAPRVIETDQVLARKTERLGGLQAYQRGVVPRELGEGVGKLLQPPVVGEAPVVKRWRGEEDDLEAAFAGSARLSPADASARLASGCAVSCGTTSGSSLPASNPSCRTRFHLLSNSPSPSSGVHVSRTMS